MTAVNYNYKCAIIMFIVIACVRIDGLQRESCKAAERTNRGQRAVFITKRTSTSIEYVISIYFCFWL